MYAFDDVGDALDATREFLLPFDGRRWLKLAFVTFFLGGVGANVSFPVTGGGTGGSPGPPPEEVWLVVGLVVAAALAVALAFAAVRSVMDFVLYESLREEAVELRRFWSKRWRQGLRLFAFRFALGLVGLVLVGIPLAMVFGPLLLGAGAAGGALVVLGALLFVPVALVVPTVGLLVQGFTTAFVVPTMIVEGGGVLDGWRRFWPTLREEWTEFLGYAVVNLVLAVAAGIVISLGSVAAALALLVPFGPLFLLGFGLASVSEPLGLAAMVAVGLVYGATAVVAAAFVKAPVVTYLRYYALFVLGDVDDDLDLVPVRRKEVRAAA